MRGYDKISENDSILLDLPFREGGGTITRDQAKPHHQDVLLINTPDFNTDLSPVSVVTLEFNGLDEYIELAAAASDDLDFVAGDYSYGVWFYWTIQELSQLLIGRYELSVSGWEIYLTESAGVHYITQRHSHAGTLVGGNPRSAVYSIGWTPGADVWYFFGTSRTGGGAASHYRNGTPIETIDGGMVDPETRNGDLTIGTRYTKNANFFQGEMWRPRLWNRALSASEWSNIFEKERGYFGI